MKKMLIILIFLAMGGFFLILSRESKPRVSIPSIPETEQPAKLCYAIVQKNPNGSIDRYWLKATIRGSVLSGEFRTMPAEKDSKIGTFEGTFVGEAENGNPTGTGEVIWNAQSEGMRNKEELLIRFRDGIAEAAFGEMIKGANGVYVYKDKATAIYQLPMQEADCSALDESIAVEAYIRSADIAALTKEKPVVGGTFFVTSVSVDTEAKSAAISYEDGHIAGSGTVSYTYDQTTKRVNVNGFTKGE